MNSIETYSLTKVYSAFFGGKNVQALTDLNLKVSEGMIFGLLGPNGAGKTTLIKLLLGIIFPTAGSAKILDEDISNYKIKKHIGYLPENHKYPSYLNGEEVLTYYGKLSGMDGGFLKRRIDELLNLMNLEKWKKTKIKAYSKGMMQRLGLAQAVLNDPKLIFLDEPTDGVDPIGRKEIRDILLGLKKQGKTIFLNSHLLSEVEMITDRVGILNKGNLLREGTVQELTENREEYKLSVEDNSIENLSKDSLDGIQLTKISNGSYSLKVKSVDELNVFVDKLRADGIALKEIAKQKNSLEDMFISLIQEADKESGK